MLSQKEKEELKNCAKSRLNLIKLKRQIISATGSNRGLKLTTWSIEDYEFLIDNFGILSKKEIAEKLNKSVNAVSIKCDDLHLIDWFNYSSEIPLNRISKLIFNKNLDSYTFGIWERYGIPVKKTMKSKYFEYKTINIKDFYSWLEQNKRIIDLSQAKENALSDDEPEWFKIKRNLDQRAYKYRGRVWTSEDDKQLKKYVKAQKLGYDEISKKMKRTYGSIKRRCLDLNLKQRPVRKPPHDGLWTNEQIEIVKKMWLQGAKSCVIAEEIEGKSAGAIQGILERYKYFGEPPLKFKL